MADDFPALVAAGRVWALDGEEGPLGYVVLVAEEDALLVETVAVAPEAQGRGLGRRLLAFAEEHARALGLPRLALYTNAAMAENLALYPRLGYRETGRRREDGFDRVFFEKPLDSMPR